MNIANSGGFRSRFRSGSNRSCSGSRRYRSRSGSHSLSDSLSSKRASNRCRILRSGSRRSRAISARVLRGLRHNRNTSNRSRCSVRSRSDWSPSQSRSGSSRSLSSSHSSEHSSRSSRDSFSCLGRSWSGSQRSQSASRRSRSGSSRSRPGSVSSRSRSRSCSHSLNSFCSSQHSSESSRNSLSCSGPGSVSSRSRSRSCSHSLNSFRSSQHSSESSPNSLSCSGRSPSGSSRSKQGSGSSRSRSRSGSRHLLSSTDSSENLSSTSRNTLSCSGRSRSGSQRSQSAYRRSQGGSLRSRPGSVSSRSRSRSGSRRSFSSSRSSEYLSSASQNSLSCSVCSRSESQSSQSQYRRSHRDTLRCERGSGSRRSRSRSGSSCSSTSSRNLLSCSVRSRSGSQSSQSGSRRSNSSSRSSSQSSDSRSRSYRSRSGSGSNSGSNSQPRSVSRSPVKDISYIYVPSWTTKFKPIVALSDSEDETSASCSKIRDKLTDLAVADKSRKRRLLENLPNSVNRKKSNILSNFDKMLLRKKEEKRIPSRKYDADSVQRHVALIDQPITKVRNTSTQERQLYHEGKTTAEKLSILKILRTQLIKNHFQLDFLEHGILGELADWLSPLPNGSLPCEKLRETILGLLEVFPKIVENYLKRSQVGKAVMLLSTHPQETSENRLIARRLIAAWTRPIFGASKRDLERMAKRRKSSDPQPSTSVAQHKEFNSALNAIAKERLRPGDLGWSDRARAPLPEPKNYFIQPKSTVKHFVMPKKRQLNPYEMQINELLRVNAQRGK